MFFSLSSMRRVPMLKGRADGTAPPLRHLDSLSMSTGSTGSRAWNPRGSPALTWLIALWMDIITMDMYLYAAAMYGPLGRVWRRLTGRLGWAGGGERTAA